MIWPEPTHPLTHPPTKSYTHPWVGNSSDFKSSNRIEISWLVQVLSNFYWFRGSSPWGMADGWMGVGVGMGMWGVSHAHTHAHTHMHMHVKHDKHAKHGCLHVGGHLQFLYMDTCAYVRAACMWGHLPCPQTPPTHLPPPQSHREPKTPKFNKSWTNRDNSILFEDSLPLNTPELI